MDPRDKQVTGEEWISFIETRFSPRKAELHKKRYNLQHGYRPSQTVLYSSGSILRIEAW